MNKFLLTIVIVISSFVGLSQTKTIHVFVALCDNENQGIVPVPESLGNGQDPKSNLYWGAMYGVKSFLRYRSNDWIYLKSLGKVNTIILERVVFKHKTKDAFLVADAYDGAYIKKCTENFLLAANGQFGETITVNSSSIGIGGISDIVAYVGHDGLMEFDVDIEYKPVSSKKKNTIILACSSKYHFTDEVSEASAVPLLWTNSLMAPEAYTLEAAIKGWLLNETGEQVKERAAQAYNKYQKCGMYGARELFSTGF